MYVYFATNGYLNTETCEKFLFVDHPKEDLGAQHCCQLIVQWNYDILLRGFKRSIIDEILQLPKKSCQTIEASI